MKLDFTEDDLKKLKELLWAIGNVSRINDLNWSGIQAKAKNFEKKIMD